MDKSEQKMQQMYYPKERKLNIILLYLSIIKYYFRSTENVYIYINIVCKITIGRISQIQIRFFNYGPLPDHDF